MKKILLSSAFSLLFFVLLTQPLFASSAYVQMNTTVEGSGSVTTHTQTTVNGQTKTFDSTDPGEHDVKVENNTSNEEEATDAIPPTLSPALIATIAPTDITKDATHAAEKPIVKVKSIQNFIHSFFSALLHFFHFS